MNAFDIAIVIILSLVALFLVFLLVGMVYEFIKNVSPKSSKEHECDWLADLEKREKEKEDLQEKAELEMKLRLAEEMTKPFYSVNVVFNDGSTLEFAVKPRIEGGYYSYLCNSEQAAKHVIHNTLNDKQALTHDNTAYSYESINRMSLIEPKG